MNTIETYNFKGKRALIRVDFNVPLNDAFTITDTTRIDAALPTIRKVLAGGGSAIVMSHLGRPKGGPENKFSLSHLLPYLKEKLGLEVKFADDCIGKSAIDLVSRSETGRSIVARKPSLLQRRGKRRSRIQQETGCAWAIAM